jgi:hypothetical protein
MLRYYEHRTKWIKTVRDRIRRIDFMLHPFKVGKTYRNRVGEYVVQSIERDQMTIRYVNGGTLTTGIQIQARIWENVQFEEQLAREEERRRLAQEARQKARRRQARAKRTPPKPRFEGFVESDFEAKKRGIAWSSRKELGAVLAHELSQRMNVEFDHWIVPRKPGVHVARKEIYDQKTRDKNAAFFVTVNEEGVRFGLRVAKPSGKAKAEWPWSAFLAALVDDQKLRRALRAAMKEHELSIHVYAMERSYGQVGKIDLQTRGFLWQHETADQEATRRMNWNQLAEYLQTVAPDKRCAVHIRKHLPASNALKAGKGISSQIADVLESLVPIYETCVGS